IIGGSEAMRRVYSDIVSSSDFKFNTLISGETGTGKELVARALSKSYKHGKNGNGFLKIDCGTLSEDTLQSELFGHVKGAFTGAHKDRKGKFVSADGGTLFLDEITNAPLVIQNALLSAVEYGDICPLGSDNTTQKRVDVRIISATNTIIQDAIEEGRFKNDLFQRLSETEINVPSLKRRNDDVPLLAYYILDKLNASFDQSLTFEDGALEYLNEFAWPGNVRQLENVIKKSVVKRKWGSDVIATDIIKKVFDETKVPADRERLGKYYKSKIDCVEYPIDFNEEIKNVEKQLIQDALDETDDNKNAAAELLGLKRTTLVEKIRRYNIGDS
ncbi:sigma-54-dependent Fis family transcriptional regulator, partial [Candidatus Pacearchaeota archaeon]|nr:sigma-54-dependent Fis family transcriptional regulator [Candidatus Pacearchaeota archaeon]